MRKNKALIRIVSFSTPLFEPETLHAENYIILPTNVGVSFINKKAHRNGALYLVIILLQILQIQDVLNIYLGAAPHYCVRL